MRGYKNFGLRALNSVSLLTILCFVRWFCEVYLLTSRPHSYQFINEGPKRQGGIFFWQKKLNFSLLVVQSPLARSTTLHLQIIITFRPTTNPEDSYGDRCIALLVRDLGARTGGGGVVSTTPRPLYPRERPGTHCTEGWVGPRAGLDVCEKSRPHRNSITGPSSP
jgi:hypothetical protein